MIYAIDKDGNTATDTGTFAVNKLAAIMVTNVAFGDFGLVYPDIESGEELSTITNSGNVDIMFVDVNDNGYNVEPDDGITWSAMTSGSDPIPADSIAIS